MPFDNKKSKPPPGPPTYQQERTVAQIDQSFGELTQVLMGASRSPEMRGLIKEISKSIGMAKRWVLEN